MLYYNDVTVRKNHDLEECKDIFQTSLGVRAFGIEKVIRLGLRGGQAGARPRPTLVKLRNVKEKWDIIGKAKELKNEQNQARKKLSIIPDMTTKEREADKKLHEELKRRKDNGERGIQIKNNSIIQIANWSEPDSNNGNQPLSQRTRSQTANPDRPSPSGAAVSARRKD